jgi:hypothetical protein
MSKILTKEGYKKIEDELEMRKIALRQEIAAAIKEAKEQGDLSENAEYSEAKRRQNENETRIMELVGVFLYDPQTDSMKPYKFSVSERLQKSQEKQKASLGSYTIETASKNNPLFAELLVHKQVVITKDLTQLWGNLLNNPGLLTQIVTDSHIQTLIVDPLLIDGQVIGAIALGLNRKMVQKNIRLGKL